MKIGYICGSSEPDRLCKCLTALTDLYNIEFFYFTEDRVDIDQKTISGSFWDKTKLGYAEKSTSYPHIIDGTTQMMLPGLCIELGKYSYLTHIPSDDSNKILDSIKNSDCCGYLIDSNIKIEKNTGNNFKIRLNVCRGENGEWGLLGMFVLVGYGKDISSNGWALDRKPKQFLEMGFGSEWKTLYDEIIFISRDLPDILQKGRRIVSLAIDVIIDNSSKVKIAGISDTPDYYKCEWQTAKSRILYYNHIYKSRKC